VSYNVFWVINSIFQNGQMEAFHFRKKPIFEILLKSAIEIANLGISSKETKVLSLVLLSFRVLESMKKPPEEGEDDILIELENVAAQLGRNFDFDRGVQKNEQLTAMVFPLLYRNGMKKVMKLFFRERELSEISSAFGSAFVEKLNQLDSDELIELLNGGLVEKTLNILKGKGEGEFQWPKNIFVFRLAEKLCNADLLPIDETKLSPQVGGIMKGKDWNLMAMKVVQQQRNMINEVGHDQRGN
jgi:hypothetical protein